MEKTLNFKEDLFQFYFESASYIHHLKQLADLASDLMWACIENRLIVVSSLGIRRGFVIIKPANETDLSPELENMKIIDFIDLIGLYSDRKRPMESFINHIKQRENLN